MAEVQTQKQEAQGGEGVQAQQRPQSRARSISRNRRVSGVKKAAILLVFLGEKVSAEVFKGLHDDEVKIISQAISDLGLVSDDVTDDILMECHRELLEGKIRLRGDLDYVRKIVESAFAPDTAKEILRYLAGSTMTTTEGLKTIKYADPQLLSKLIQDEHPQTISVVLTHLDPEQAAEVIRLLPEEMRSDVATRLAQLDQISQPVRNKVTEIVAARLREGGQFDQGSQGGLRKVAEIFNRMDRSMSRETLESIESENPNLALSIRNLMFVFDDILLLNDADMRKIIQKVDKKVLVQALKGTPEELRDHFYRNMSQRAVDMLKEDMDATGPVRLKDAEAARQQVVGVIREMEAEGLIDIRGSGGDEYVD